MENKKCTSKEHSDIIAISFCQICDIYMCNKCEKIHNNLCSHHQTYNLNNNIDEIFNGICQEKKHFDELEYYCKNHNKLCCAACLCKIKSEKNGQHKDCDVCLLIDIKEEKKKKFEENIKYLNELFGSLEKFNNELKLLFENINKTKEELKLEILNVFTKFRNALNEREEELLSEIDKKYEECYFSENLVKESEKLPQKVKISLEKSKKINNEWNDNNKLAYIINESIKIENNIKYINSINDSIKKSKSNNYLIKFIPEEEINKFLNEIRKFGNILKIQKEEKNCFFNFIKKSNIIKPEEMDLILSWFNLRPNKFNLLLDSKIDGDLTSTFVNKCASKFPTMLFIKSTDGYRFGGYTSKKWGIDCDSNDECCFIFSLDLKEKYPIKESKYATMIRQNNWLSFGSGSSLYLYNGCTSRNDNYTGSSNFNFPKNKSEINGNKPRYTVSSYEVYEVQF